MFGLDDALNLILIAFCYYYIVRHLLLLAWHLLLLVFSCLPCGCLDLTLNVPRFYSTAPRRYATHVALWFFFVGLFALLLTVI